MRYSFTKKNIIIFVISVIMIFTVLYGVRYALKPKEDDLLLKNVKNMQQNIEKVQSGIEDIRNVEKGIIKKRIEDATKEQFEEDEAFLNEIIDLKKIKMIAELKRDIEILSSPAEKSKPRPIDTNIKPFVKEVLPQKTASDFIRVFAINYLKKKAVIFVNNTKRVVKEGDNIADYTLLEIKENAVVVRKEGNPPETIYLGYEEAIPSGLKKWEK